MYVYTKNGGDFKANGRGEAHLFPLADCCAPDPTSSDAKAREVPDRDVEAGPPEYGWDDLPPFPPYEERPDGACDSGPATGTLRPTYEQLRAFIGRPEQRCLAVRRNVERLLDFLDLEEGDGVELLHIYDKSRDSLGRTGTHLIRYTAGKEGLAKVMEWAESHNGRATSLHLTLNPIDISLVENSATAACVRRRKILLVDCDPCRPDARSSATAEEKQKAFHRAGHIWYYLVHVFKFPPCLIADSGNGYHLLFRIDLPTDDDGLVQSFLYALDALFGNDDVRVDVTVSDAIRRTKLYGTKVCKGEDAQERPHRDSEVLYAPEEASPVSATRLQRVIDVAEKFLQKEYGADGGAASLPKTGAKPRRRYFPRPDGLTRNEMIRRATAYVTRMPVAVQGERGHYDLFAVACVLIRDAALTIEEARLILHGYASRCEPPWEPHEYHELEHKLKDADKFDGFRGKLFVVWGNCVMVRDEKGKLIPQPFHAHHIHRILNAITGDWPRRMGDSLFVSSDGGQVQWLDRTNQLFAWVSGQIPPRQSSPILWDSRSLGSLPRDVFMSYLQQQVRNYDSVEVYPHFPPLMNSYYAQGTVRPGDGKTLEALLDRFRPATPLDRQLMKSAVMTVLWGGPPGQRPAFLIESDAEETGDDKKGRGAGKTTFAQMVAATVGGYIDVRPTSNDEAIKKRLLSPEARDRRVALIDNIKTHRFSWDDLESLITAEVLSGHRMYRGEGRRQNYLTWFLTLNGASLSKDMAQRVVPIRVSTRGEHSDAWREKTLGMIHEQRQALFADILAVFATPVKRLGQSSRWALWERDVLSRLDDPDGVLKMIVERRDVVDDEQEESALVRDYFVDRLGDYKHDPGTAVVLIPVATAATWLNVATGENRATNRASSHLQGLSIPELKKSRRGEGRAWIWRGKQANGEAQAEKLGGAR